MVVRKRKLLTWPPEQIAHTITKGIISFKTIYHWLYAGRVSSVSKEHLRRKGKRKTLEKRGKFSMGTPISLRPQVVGTRSDFGHWELDSMLSS